MGQYCSRSESKKPILGTAQKRPTVVAGQKTAANSQLDDKKLLRVPAVYDVSLAALLAGYAFESYMEPSVAGNVVTSGQSGTNISLTSLEFAQGMFSGVVSVTLVPMGVELSTGLDITMTLVESHPSQGADSGSGETPLTLRNPRHPVLRSYAVSKQTGEVPPTTHLFVRDPHSASLSVRVSKTDGVIDFNMGEMSISIMNGTEPVQGFTMPLAIHPIDLPFESGEQSGQVSVVHTPLTDSPDCRALFIPAPSPNDPTFQSWMDLSSYAKEAKIAGSVQNSVRDLPNLRKLPQICCLDNTTGDTQASIWADIPLRQVVIAFRGTQPLKIRSLLSDAKVLKRHFDSEHPILKTLSIHGGFLDAYEPIRGALLQVLHSLFTREAPEGAKPWDIYVTGHSLGGALSVLCSFDLGRIRAGMFGYDGSDEEEKHDILPHSEKVIDAAVAFERDEQFLTVLRAANLTMYSVASPVIGCEAFSQLFSKFVPQGYRLYNVRDIIPFEMAKCFQYIHCGIKVPLHTGDKDPNNISGCEHFADVCDGFAINQHLTPQYFKSIQNAVRDHIRM